MRWGHTIGRTHRLESLESKTEWPLMLQVALLLYYYSEKVFCDHTANPSGKYVLTQSEKKRWMEN